MPDKYIDYKVTVWNRLHISDDDYKAVMKSIKDTDDFTMEDIDELICDDVENETLYECIEYIDPKENDNQATIEIYDDGKFIKSNGGK